MAKLKNCAIYCKACKCRVNGSYYKETIEFIRLMAITCDEWEPQIGIREEDYCHDGFHDEYEEITHRIIDNYSEARDVVCARRQLFSEKTPAESSEKPRELELKEVSIDERVDRLDRCFRYNDKKIESIMKGIHDDRAGYFTHMSKLQELMGKLSAYDGFIDEIRKLRNSTFSSFEMFEQRLKKLEEADAIS